MIALLAKLVRPGLLVGPAHPRDVPAIVDLLRSVASECIPLGAAEVLRRLPEFELARSPSGYVVGCAAVRCQDGRAELRSVAVDDGWRGSGVGRELVRRAQRRAAALGLDLFCVSRNPGFFESLGFQRRPLEPVPERPGASPDGPARVVLSYPFAPSTSPCEVPA